jgi:hypothetical protein
MAGNGNARGGLGWVILVVALAVPGVLFYNWWSHLKADREKTVAAKARGRVPDGGVFQSSPNAKLVNPMTPVVSTGAPSAQPQVAASTAPAQPVLAQPAQAAVIAKPVGEAGAGLAVVAAAAAAPSVAAVPPALSFSSMTASAQPLKRDPTLSPFDQVRLVEEEEAKRKAADDLAAMQAAKNGRGRKGPKPVKDPRTLVDLQGIISNTDSGFKAIVNNEVMSVGEFVAGTRIKIVKITDLGVTFDLQGKRFVKGVSQ